MGAAGCARSSRDCPRRTPSSTVYRNSQARNVHRVRHRHRKSRVHSAVRGVNSDMSLDVAHKRIYVTGSETATVIEQRDADHYEHIAEVPTAYRAKSSIFVPELKRLYIADSGKGKPDAKLALQIFEAQ